MTFGAVLALALLFSSITAGCEPVRSRPVDPAGAGGLAPTRQDPDAGLIGIAAGFDPAAYRVIEVARFAVMESSAWEQEDRRIVSAVTAFFQADLGRRLSASGAFRQVVELDTRSPTAERALRLEGSITRLELDYLEFTRHSRWVGPGSVQVETRLIDVASGAIVVVTADRRTARRVTSVTRDPGGTETLLEEALGYIASDLVHFLARLASGGREPT